MAASPPLATGNDYWTNEFDPGTSSTWTFAGQDGLDRRSGFGAFTAPVPEEFRTRLTRVQLDHVALEAERSTPHRFERGETRIAADPTPMMVVMLVVEGHLVFEQPSGGFDLGEGQVVVLDTRFPVVYTATGGTRIVRALVGIEHVPPYLQSPGRRPNGPLARTALVDSFISFISTILRNTASGKRAQGDHLVRAVADLQTAVIAEAAAESPHETGSAGLRVRMEEFIEAHLADPGLSPTSIAEAVGISLRQAHMVFNAEDRTLARFIRERRVSAVALELRSQSDQVRLDDLAERHGFANSDTMGRAFRSKFRMAPIEYWREGHLHFGDGPGGRQEPLD